MQASAQQKSHQCCDLSLVLPNQLSEYGPCVVLVKLREVGFLRPPHVENLTCVRIPALSWFFVSSRARASLHRPTAGTEPNEALLEDSPVFVGKPSKVFFGFFWCPIKLSLAPPAVPPSNSDLSLSRVTSSRSKAFGGMPGSDFEGKQS